MDIEELKKITQLGIIDYQFLMSALKSYSAPRDKISEWLKSGDLIRIKKGLYIFGSKTNSVSYSIEILANLIYGPSAISLQYALSYYGLIPERVTTITNITPKRVKKFVTPIGHFHYYHIHPEKYATGIEIKTTVAQYQFLMASPEKALCDQLTILDKKIILRNSQEMENYLFADMRIDENLLRQFRSNKMLELKKVYQDNKVNLLTAFVKKL